MRSRIKFRIGRITKSLTCSAGRPGVGHEADRTGCRLAVSHRGGQWRGRPGSEWAHGRKLFSPVLVVDTDRDPIRRLPDPRDRRRRPYFVHVHLSHGDSPRAVARRGRNSLPRREMRRGDQRHRDTGSLGAHAGCRRALDQRDAEIPWVSIRQLSFGIARLRPRARSEQRKGALI